MPKKFFRSALLKRPLPSAMLAAIDRAARLSWSADFAISGDFGDR